MNKGVFFAVAAFVMWGVLPLYWRLLDEIDPFHLLAFRILLSLVLLGGILACRKNFVWITAFKDAKKAWVLIFASIVLCVNWGVFIWAISNDRVIEASLGYYINPLFSVVLGMFFLKEKLSPLQWAAFGFACLGVLILTLLSGALPWISVVLALCFGFYGLLKKKLKLSSMESLTAETLIAAPLGIFLLFVRVDTDGGLRLLADMQNLSYMADIGINLWIILAFSGLVTSLPLYLFGNGAKLLPLSTLGFIQFIAPTMTFFIGVFVFREFFPPYHYAAFAFIWLAAILYVVSLRRQVKGAG